jgi:ADP-ribose pyrophosphatase YjhB (NUDIX family)
VDAGEDPRRAAQRECLEETGLNVEIGDLVEVISGAEHPRGADIVIIYRADVIAGTLVAGDDVDQAAFFGIDRLPELAFRSTQLVIEKLSAQQD